ncbi:unnamed protein product [Ranitomeya imitator]|uniref:Uncharacterized protein n=1 Tax=Ranitomeya imitator TaxID=111125 RepID=A0ABN9LGP4_9NEOB|nr:unnamed protein product [Ranitomeya imitator]
MSCPKCRRKCSADALSRVNFNLGNIAEYYKSVKGCQRPEEVPCSFCILFPSTAARTCLHCEASFCRQHLELHSRSKEHILVDPTTSIRSRKCYIHNEIFKYYCVNDQACICPSCCLSGHKDHDIGPLDQAVQREKHHLITILQGLKAEWASCKETEAVSRSIFYSKEKSLTQVKRDFEGMHNDLRDRILEAHVDVMKEVCRHLREVAKQVCGEMNSVRKTAAEMSLDVDEASSTTMDLFSTSAEAATAGRYIDRLLISLLLQKGINDVSDSLPLFLSSKLFHLQYKVDLLLKVETASNYLSLSADLRGLSYSMENIHRETTPSQFKPSQVISVESFASGRHFWEVKTSKLGVKAVGIAYPTMERSGLKAFLGYNEKSWCLIWSPNCIEVYHNSDCTQIESDDGAVRGVGVFLDCEAGRLSFYRLSGKVRRLHTISASFTEPLHAAFYVVNGWIKINPPMKQNK